MKIPPLAIVLIVAFAALVAVSWVPGPVSVLSLGRNRLVPVSRGPGPSSSSDSEEASQGGDVHAQGRLVPASAVWNVAAPMGERVERLHVHEGDYVGILDVPDKDGNRFYYQRGDQREGIPGLGELSSCRLRQLEREAIVAQLADTKLLRAAEQRAMESDVEVAQQAVAQARGATSRFTTEAQQVELLRSVSEQADAELEKLKLLRSTSDVVSGYEYRRKVLAVMKAKTDFEHAQNELQILRESAAQQIRLAEAKQASVVAGHERALAGMSSTALDKKLELVDEQLRLTQLPPPAAGTILKVSTPPGQVVGRNPVLQMADLRRMHCVAEVYESLVKRIRAGQPVVLESDSFSEAFAKTGLKGEVISVGSMMKSPDLNQLDPFAKSDVRVVEVGIKIEGAEQIREAARLVNLQVNVVIKTD